MSKHSRTILIAAALALSLAPTVCLADLVFGRVSGGGFNAKKDKFTIDGIAIPVAVNARGEYRVALDPGTYTVRFRNLCATIVSDSEPVRQDVVFRPCKK
jgi:hypothetical protein